MYTMHKRLVAKLQPDRFNEMSGKMAAVVGYILNEPFSEPRIASLAVTAEGIVVAQPAGEGHSEFLGTEADLNRNLVSLVEAAGLDPDEAAEFGRLQRERITRYSDHAG
jgi:hypothetical protein